MIRGDRIFFLRHGSPAIGDVVREDSKGTIWVRECIFKDNEFRAGRGYRVPAEHCISIANIPSLKLLTPNIAAPKVIQIIPAEAEVVSEAKRPKTRTRKRRKKKKKKRR